MGANPSHLNVIQTKNNKPNKNNDNSTNSKSNSKITPQQIINKKNTYEQNFDYLLTILEKSTDINNYETNVKNQTEKINNELSTKTNKLKEVVKSNDDYYLTQKKMYIEINENVKNYEVINSILGYSLIFLFVILLLLLSIKILGGKI